jgi:hypothetical protein
MCKDEKGGEEKEVQKLGAKACDSAVRVIL